MKKYELTILEPENSTEEPNSAVELLVATMGGRVLSAENLGVKKLSYPIKGYEKVSYHFYTLELPDLEVARAINIMLEHASDDLALRHLIVSVDDRHYTAKEEA